MKKIMVIPDSFKGTMSSQEFCDIAQKAIACEIDDAYTLKIPVADGGEGSVDAFLTALNGEKQYVQVQGPFGEKINSFYGVVGNTAIIEMAAAAGLPLVGENLKVESTTTYGVGELIKHAVDNYDIKRLILALGGSATNDGGCGMAAALGVEFYDKDKLKFVPVGETLCKIESININNILPQLKDIEIIAMCDIDNPLCGKQGAAWVFAPQKGANSTTVTLLDQGLYHMANIIKRDIHIDVVDKAGAGAAGGMGAGAVAFLNAKLKMGIEVVLDTIGFDELCENTDLIITGEGKIDGQSLRGKVVMVVAQRAKKFNVPTIAVVGDIEKTAYEGYDKGLWAIFSINHLAVPYSLAKTTAKDDLYYTIKNIIRYTKMINKH